MPGSADRRGEEAKLSNLKNSSAAPLRLDWGTFAEPEWEASLSAACYSSLEQSWSYGEALERVEKCRVRRAVVSRDGRPLALVQTFEKANVLPLSLVRILRGPVWLADDLDRGQRGDVLRLIRDEFRLLRRRLLIWTPELHEAPQSHALMRACGMRRMVTGYSTALLDLSRPLEDLRAGLCGKWRNRLVAAEQAGLSIRLAAGGRTFNWLVDRAEAHRRAKGYFGTPAALTRAMADHVNRQDSILVLTAAAARERVAGVLLFRHGRTATFVQGWSGDEGRRRQAHNLLLWRAITELRNRGIAWLDLGGVSATAPGVARFKLGLGASLHSLSGTYI